MLIMTTLCTIMHAQEQTQERSEPQFTFANAKLAKVTTNSAGIEHLSYLKRDIVSQEQSREVQTANGIETRTVMVFVAVGEPKGYDIPLKDVDVWSASGERLDATEIKAKLKSPRAVFLLECKDYADYKSDSFFAGLINQEALIVRLNCELNSIAPVKK